MDSIERCEGYAMKRLILACALITLISPVNASLISRDLFSVGVGLVTYDSESGLEWLDA